MKNFRLAVLTLLTVAVPAFSQIPSNAVSTGEVTGSGSWTWSHDSGTPGTSTGSSTYPVSSPSKDGASRLFHVSYWDRGGERYHLTLAHNTGAYTHFVYDTYVYIEDTSQIANLEMDLNQVLDNGKTVIMATQCSSYTGTWEWSNISSGHPHWHSSNLSCNPKSWGSKTWHHVQIGEHRDSSGNVTHDWIGFDGKISYFHNAYGYSGAYLGWEKGIFTLNAQLDGASSNSGSMKVYFDKTKVYRW